MLVRIRSAKGMLRVELQPTDDIQLLIQKVSRIYPQAKTAETLQMDPNSFLISNQPSGARPFPKQGRSCQALGIQHGDLIYVSYDRTDELQEATPLVPAEQAVSARPDIKVDQVDLLLEKDPGLIQRSRDANFCRHGANAMCDYCMPLEPYDQNHLERNKIKHMSFHAYLRKLNAGSKTKDLPTLDEPSFIVRPDCDTGHAPYPQSMCAKCQPSALVLQSQVYRMVDHVEFESAQIVDQFLSFWRQSGLQRFGYLYGRYERYTEVPLGIKAVVAAIYEPAQHAAVDGIELLEQDPHGEAVAQVSQDLGLQKIGMIYTDLHDDGTGTGKVICRRYTDTFFVSSAETAFMAHAQLDHPNPCKLSSSGHFGSKFVTVIVSGDEENNVHLSAYQVSDIGTAMVRDRIVDATVKPDLMRVPESTSTQYVPEVFYKFKNKYGALVQEAAKPTFPVEYLLVSLTDGFPQQPRPFFQSTIPFPIENRAGLNVQDMKAVRQHLEKNVDLQHALSDLHFLLHLKSTGLFQDDDWKSLLKSVMVEDRNVFEVEVSQNASWQTLQTIAREASTANHDTQTASASSRSSLSPWSCRHCTFTNAARRSDCEMCGLPQNG